MLRGPGKDFKDIHPLITQPGGDYERKWSDGKDISKKLASSVSIIENLHPRFYRDTSSTYLSHVKNDIFYDTEGEKALRWLTVLKISSLL